MKNVLKYIRATNIYLISKCYPWLIPSWLKEEKTFLKRYSQTFLDDLPHGWHKAFGWELVRDIDLFLEQWGIKDYELYQAKEKFGSLCWYDNGGTQLFDDVISKYERISEHTCLVCGKKAKWFKRNGWISPYCDKCKKMIEKNNSEAKFVKLDDKGL